MIEDFVKQGAAFVTIHPDDAFGEHGRHVEDLATRFFLHIDSGMGHGWEVGVEPPFQRLQRQRGAQQLDMVTLGTGICRGPAAAVGRQPRRSGKRRGPEAAFPIE